ncbi:hypothetical protein ZEAMMB73_Zm00001d011601 [Zea mays]|uniref:Uncharacterized protein n=2 Tax=Zea mays TaxID=4577 RepID=A0A1D6G1R8_MAIZE|nr:hypothetical protein ZEAMMB73_Zm00001d011601 [Zea mays]AQK97354.1 hypothetical protein ZEAMMB73_Zm00001d011601 [Zea mays]AQK97356.1 hypothetical protein ZEAMMB73_Zm00001d011601 [Zea mays]AQK97364.1 hypothetical protein ZEAMMB73_Zm00001d011601 [Zea mays]AQK97367.1 hypothetical protein ZEAMMB73_Zm00001d011601 [Zea mays]
MVSAPPPSGPFPCLGRPAMDSPSGLWWRPAPSSCPPFPSTPSMSPRYVGDPIVASFASSQLPPSTIEARPQRPPLPARHGARLATATAGPAPPTATPLVLHHPLAKAPSVSLKPPSPTDFCGSPRDADACGRARQDLSLTDAPPRSRRRGRRDTYCRGSPGDADACGGAWLDLSLTDERLRPTHRVPVVHLGLLLGATSPPSPRCCTCLYRGDMPKHVTEANLLVLFCEVATVEEVTIIKDKATKVSRGVDLPGPRSGLAALPSPRLLPLGSPQCCDLHCSLQRSFSPLGVGFGSNVTRRSEES